MIEGVSRNRAHRVVLAATALLFVARAALAFLRTGPVVVADETGYLTNARIFSGGLPGQMANAPFYRGGYSLLITPLVAIAHDPLTAYRLVLVANAALAASLVPATYLLLRRCLGAHPGEAAWAAIAAGMYPSVTAFSQGALSENALLPLTALWLLALGIAAGPVSARARFLATAATAALAGALLLVHGRMIAAVGVTVIAFVALGALRRLRTLDLVAGFMTLVGALLVVRTVDAYLVRRNYAGPRPNEASQRLSNLEHVHGLAAAARNLVGQSWYVVAATLGVVVLAGLTLSARDAAARLRRGEPGALVVAAATLTALALLVATALSFPDLERPDMLVYGRYVEIVVPPLVAASLLRLLRVGIRRIGLAITIIAVSTAVTAILQATLGPKAAANGWDVASLPFLTLDVRPAAIVGAGIVAGVCTLVVAQLARRHILLVAPTVALLFVGPALEAEHASVLASQHSVYPAGWTSPRAAASRATEIGYDAAHRSGLFVNEWFLPDARIILFRGTPRTRYVISSADWGRSHAALKPRLVWRDTGHDRAMFVLAR